MNQPPPDSGTVAFEQLVELIDDAVVLRNTGVSQHERYADPDDSWSPPAGSLPPGLEQEGSLTLDKVIENAGEPEIDDQP